MGAVDLWEARSPHSASDRNPLDRRIPAAGEVGRSLEEEAERICDCQRYCRLPVRGSTDVTVDQIVGIGGSEHEVRRGIKVPRNVKGVYQAELLYRTKVTYPYC